MKLANICVRAGVNQQAAWRAYMAALKQKADEDKNKPPKDETWATKVEVAKTEYVVGQVNKFPMFFVCFPCPYQGFSDAAAMVKPIEGEEALLEQLKNPVLQTFFVG
tara:strand:+ start:4925 stop:5245 length:321 start_codon:yes stop_codon:yes gene_type:complete